MLLLDNIQKIKSSFRYEIINTQCSLRCLSVKANTSKLSVLNAVDPETPQSQPRPEFDVALTEMTPTNFTVNNSVTLSGSLNNTGESAASNITKEPPETTSASITHMTVTAQKGVKNPTEGLARILLTSLFTPILEGDLTRSFCVHYFKRLNSSH